MSLQFDQQRIAVRERNVIEIFDLALGVLRERGWPLLNAFIIGVLPFALLNGLLLFGLLTESDIELGEWWETRSLYIYWMIFLITLETPLATSLMTIYLGQTMFQERPTVRQVATDFRKAIPQLLFYQFFLRGLCWPLQISILLPYVWYPYLNEIILLEKNPLRAGSRRSVTTSLRSHLLHGASRNMVFGRWLAALCCGAVMGVALFGALDSVVGMLAGHLLSDETSMFVLLPLSMWSVMGFFTVVRFLCYLDLRIRTEGWEVELLMRAEAARLGRQWA